MGAGVGTRAGFGAGVGGLYTTGGTVPLCGWAVIGGSEAFGCFGGFDFGLGGGGGGETFGGEGVGFGVGRGAFGVVGFGVGGVSLETLGGEGVGFGIGGEDIFGVVGFGVGGGFSLGVGIDEGGVGL